MLARLRGFEAFKSGFAALPLLPLGPTGLGVASPLGFEVDAPFGLGVDDPVGLGVDDLDGGWGISASMV